MQIRLSYDKIKKNNMLEEYMEGIDLLQTLPSGVEGMIMAGGILMLSFFIVMFIVVKKDGKAKSFHSFSDF